MSYEQLDGRETLNAISDAFRKCTTLAELHAETEKGRPHLPKIKAWNVGWHEWLRECWKYHKNRIEGKYGNN